MKKLQTVNIEQLSKLENIGFDWFDEENPITIQLALKWLRDVKGIKNGICPAEYYNRYYGMYETKAKYDFEDTEMYETDCFDSFEETESALLDEILQKLI